MSDTLCDKCGAALEIGDFPFCPHGSTRRYHSPFVPYTVSADGQTYVIDSLQSAQRIERETEKMYNDHARYSNGKLVAPLIFRAFHQDKSNLDKSTLPPPSFDDSYRHDRRKRD